jgi:rSAM/selenodomain-associated transferase 1
MRRALLIVGKAPAPGQAKTRLVPPLSAQAAAELYCAFLLDTLDLAAGLGWERISLVHPAGAGPTLSPLLPPHITLCEQRGHGLGDALRSAFAEHLAEGFARVVLIGSDTPNLPPSAIEAGCAALATHDLSIGPSLDGGYYLLGLRRMQPALFEAIDWSTPRVLAQTLARARQLRLRVQRLPAWYDVDAPADLERLQRELHHAPATTAPHTRAALARLRPQAELSLSAPAP